MNGKWQKEVPSINGLYWAADRDGHQAGPFRVIKLDGQMRVLVPGFSTSHEDDWCGWFWSEPIPEPPKPPAWID
jgi:hypothetical protein